MKLRLVTVFVDDQEKAQRFYTETLGMVTKDDYTNDGYRWLTVTNPEDDAGVELLLALNSDPAAAAFQRAQFANEQPAIMFTTDDVQADHDRIAANGGEFMMPPADVHYAIIATLPDGCGNLLQLTQLKRW